jgi:hypothetical protein
LGLSILYEIQDIGRFARVQQFLSYGRLPFVQFRQVRPSFISPRSSTASIAGSTWQPSSPASCAPPPSRPLAWPTPARY